MYDSKQLHCLASTEKPDFRCLYSKALSESILLTTTVLQYFGARFDALLRLYKSSHKYSVEIFREYIKDSTELFLTTILEHSHQLQHFRATFWILDEKEGHFECFFKVNNPAFPHNNRPNIPRQDSLLGYALDSRLKVVTYNKSAPDPRVPFFDPKNSSWYECVSACSVAPIDSNYSSNLSAVFCIDTDKKNIHPDQNFITHSFLTMVQLFNLAASLMNISNTSLLSFIKKASDPVKGEPFMTEEKEVWNKIKNANYRILCISDLHFGGFFVDGHRSPTEALRDLLLGFPAELKPDFLVVAGDLTSIADDDEFSKAATFLNELTSDDFPCMKDSSLPRKKRTLIVPGNHDNRWLVNGTFETDRLEAFLKYIQKEGGFVTPFSENEKNDGYSIYSQYTNDDIPPYAVIVYPNEKLAFSLLTTSYYSGEPSNSNDKEIMTKIFSLFKKASYDSSNLTEIVREDKGYFPLDGYLKRIAQVGSTLPDRNEYIGVAIAHHPLINFGEDPSCCHAEYLRHSLKSQDFSWAVTGHSHVCVEKYDKPVDYKIVNLATPTLSAKSRMEDLGFAMFCISNEKRPEHIVWRFKSGADFIKNDSYMYVSHIDE